MLKRFRRITGLLLAGITVAVVAPAAVKLPALLSDHMVVQQQAPVRIWGTADPGEAVTVAINGQSAEAKAGANGKWEAWLQPMKAGGPYELTVHSGDTIVIHDVLIGEVWVGSGQSNMQFDVQGSDNAAQAIASANEPAIRLFQVKLVESDQPLDDVTGVWKICTPETVPRFSAVEYFFGSQLRKHLNVPMGLIQSAWGGTPAQSWTSRPALESEPLLKFIFDDWTSILAKYPVAKQEYEKRLAEWEGADRKAQTEGKHAPHRPWPPPGPGHPSTPSGLYNAMIAPLTPYAIRGVIWYQGESDASKKYAYIYRRLFRTMIEDWRRAWGQGDFPFLFVQIANFKANPYWPIVRESQADALALRNTAMAVIIDIGESHDIHPKNKQEVGRRLSLAARKLAYGEQLEYSGPLFRQVTPEPGVLRVWFHHAGGLAAAGGGALKGFTIAAGDGNFVPAEARLDGETVVVSAAEVPDPVAVRYGWADDPDCNLVNGAGLPASPFRTDVPRS